MRTRQLRCLRVQLEPCPSGRIPWQLRLTFSRLRVSQATSSERGTLARDVRTISKVSPLAGANCSSAATQLARTRAAQHRHVSTSSCANTADGQPERAGLACSPQTEGHPLAPLHCEARHRRFFVSQLCRSRLCSVVQQKRNFDHFV